MSLIKLFLSAAAALVVMQSTKAIAGTYYDGHTGSAIDQNEILKKVLPGQILIVSEIHDNVAHHQNQVSILNMLASANNNISVGMEFFYYPQQNFVDQYLANSISEENFLKLVDWGSISFDLYRYQVLFPREHGGQTLALNLPRTITGKVSKNGLDSLTPDERKFLPPDFTMGRDSYFERFKEVMGGHVPPDSIIRYFTSQSLWDDTMAWKATDYISNNPNSILVIIVGDFHVAYQDGLISRLKARGAKNILSVSQVDTTGYDNKDRNDMIAPNPVYGDRADFVFDAAK